MDYSIKSIREKFKKQGVFYTPPQLGEFILNLYKETPKEAYDPTCGRGNLLSMFGDEVKKYGQEIDADAVADALIELPNADIRQGDTIKKDAFPERTFDLIVANPPFSISYENDCYLENDTRYADAPCLPPPSKADYLFNLHIIAKLSNHGVAYVYNFPGILYRGQREGKIRSWLIEQNVIDAIYQIPPKQFTDTPIAICLIVFRKDRKKHSILMVDVEKNLQRNVPIDEITKNDGNLSVSSYVVEQIKEEKKDPKQLQDKAHAETLRIIRASVEFEKLVCKYEGWDFGKYLKDYYELLNELRQESIF